MNRRNRELRTDIIKTIFVLIGLIAIIFFMLNIKGWQRAEACEIAKREITFYVQCTASEHCKLTSNELQKRNTYARMEAKNCLTD